MGKEYMNLLIKHYDLQKMKCFKRSKEIKEILKQGTLKIFT